MSTTALCVKGGPWIKRCKKLAKVNLGFSSKKITNSYLLLFLSSQYPKFSTEKKLDDFSAANMTKIKTNVKKDEDGLVEQQSFVGWKYRPYREKKRLQGEI